MVYLELAVEVEKYRRLKPQHTKRVLVSQLVLVGAGSGVAAEMLLFAGGDCAFIDIENIPQTKKGSR